MADVNKPLKCLMFDSWYTQFRGAVANIAVLDGAIRKGNLFSLKIHVVFI